LIRYNGKEFLNFTTRDGLAGNNVQCIQQDREGNLWFGALGGGVSCYDRSEFVNFNTEDGLAHNDVFDIIQDREGNFWFACYHGGISRYNPYDISSISDESVREVMMQDRGGNLWWGFRNILSRFGGSMFISTYRGICQYTPDVVFENTLFFPHLKRDFVDNKLEETSYQVYEVRGGEVQKTTYTKAGTEKLELAGRTYKTIILDKLNHQTGLKVRLWLNIETGYLLKAAYEDRISYRADSSVVKKIQTANLDKDITAKTNVLIADVQAISYMKVKATIEPVGLWVTTESLNVPGQSFTGTVDALARGGGRTDTGGLG